MYSKPTRVRPYSCSAERRTPIGIQVPSRAGICWMMTSEIYRMIQALHAATEPTPDILSAQFRKYAEECPTASAALSTRFPTPPRSWLPIGAARVGSCQ
jgi:hypothetical protein